MRIHRRFSSSRLLVRIVVPVALGIAALEACSGGDDGTSVTSGDSGIEATGDADLSDASSDDGATTDAGPQGMHILAFSGGNPPSADSHYAAIAGSGVLTGPVIIVMWGDIDNADGGTLDWSSFDGTSSVLQNLLSSYPNEKVSIVFEPASDVMTNSKTPNDVLNSSGQQICFCDGYAGDVAVANYGCYPNGKVNGTTADFTGLPVPFTGTFAARWQGFIGQAIARLNAASYRSSILYVTFGVSNGGEDIPRCSADEAKLASPQTTAGLSATWMTNLDQQDTAIEAAHPSFPVVVGTSCLGASEPPDGSTSIDNCPLFADLEAKTNAAHGVGIRITTLQNADLLAFGMGTPTVSDWVADTANYPNVPIVWQPSYESAPVSGSDDRCNRTGSLATLLPFVSLHSSPTTPLRALEIYYQDLEGTYVGAAGYQDSCWPSGTVTTDPYKSYDDAFRAVIAP
jgi:hypothetical protein